MADEAEQPVEAVLSDADKQKVRKTADEIRAQNKACGVAEGPLSHVVNGCVTERSPDAMRVRTPAPLLGGVRG